MKKEYDFSKGERGKFYHPDAELSIPIYLEPDVAKVFRSSAAVSQALRSLREYPRPPAASQRRRVGGRPTPAGDRQR
jgi:hypothetical protein